MKILMYCEIVESRNNHRNAIIEFIFIYTSNETCPSDNHAP